MRIKSYFAPSVQSAISLARKEFGDDVTLVTSHAASLEARHLGEYEVVFAVEEPADAAESIKTATEPAPFQQVLQEAIATPPSTQENLADKLDRVRSLLVEMGIDAAMVRALMTMIGRSASAPLTESEPDAYAEPSEQSESTAEAEAVADEPEAEAATPESQFTPAEMAFFLSVSAGS